MKKREVSKATTTKQFWTWRYTRHFFVMASVIALTLSLALLAPPKTSAAFPGTNGPIAFVSSRDGNAEIYIMNADGSGVTRLTTNSANDEFPAWSPDGSKIVFTSGRSGNDEIYVMNADGSSVTRLTNNSAADRYAAWSPDGRRIIFASLSLFSRVGKI